MGKTFRFISYLYGQKLRLTFRDNIFSIEHESICISCSGALFFLREKTQQETHPPLKRC